MRLLAATVLAGLTALPMWGQTDDAAMPAGTQKAVAQLRLPAPKIAPNVPLSQRERAVQMLNRFAYGPRPGDVERVLQLGPDKWFQQQLNPAGIGDPVADARMKDYPTLGLNAEQTLTTFPTDGYVRQVAGGQRPYPADPLLDSLYEVQVYRYQQTVVDKLHPFKPPTDEEKAAAKKAAQPVAARVAGQLLALPKAERFAALDALPVEDRVAFAENVRGDQKNLLMAEWTPHEREVFTAMQGGTNVSFRIGDELAQAKVVRSIVTERQLQEVMTDFWFNHFNIYEPKDSDQWYTTSYERDTIRPHALGKFRDLLLATAESPAMMVYLDNWLSIGPNSRANGVNPQNPNAKKGTKGLNENYGREVMELHTVGVNGGYSQADVTSLAAMLTGWGVDDPGHGGGFKFDATKHEPGTKSWFGYTIDEQGNVLSGPPLPAALAKAIADARTPDGMKQGLTALILLAGSPKTAHFISYLLAQRFVADEPPPALVDRMTATYLKSDGDIKAVLQTLESSPEFNSHRYFRNKVKTPFEFVASTFRATATDPQNPGVLVNQLDRLFGEALYRALPPTGYYITADHWMNTQSLMVRLNFADQLTKGKVPGQKFDATRLLALSLMSDRNPGVASVGEARAVQVSAEQPGAGPSQGSELALKVLEGTLIGGEISPNTDRFIRGQLGQQAPQSGANLANATDTLNLLAALLLGSPEFQLR